MADDAGIPPTPSGAEGWLSWDNISAIVNVIGFILLGISVPLFQFLSKKQKEKKALARDANDKYLLEKINSVTDPISDKLDTLEKQTVDLGKNTNKIMHMLEKMEEGFHDFRNEQRDINAKVSYIDQVFQDNLSFGGRDPSSTSIPRRKKSPPR